MTDLTARVSRLRFRTVGEIKMRGKYRKVIIEAKPDYAIVRLEGMRIAYSVSWEGIFWLGAKHFAAQTKAEKLAARKAKKGV